MDKEYQAFKKLYIARQMQKHSGNPYWATEEQTYENLGGLDAVYDVFCAFQWVSKDAQQRICGFTMTEVLAAMQ